MSDMEAQLRLQAYADGELPAAEAAAVEALLAKDASARTTVETLRNTRAALRDYATSVRVPETREFYWSKIQREIERQERRQETAAAPAAPSWVALLRRMLVPAGALAAVMIAGFVTLRQTGVIAPVRVPPVEASLSGGGTFTYRNFATRTTLVWLSYPAEKGLASR